MSNSEIRDHLHGIPALGALPGWQFEHILEAASVIDIPRKQMVLERGSDDGFTYFVLDGSLDLLAPDGARTQVGNGSRCARVPVAQLRPRLYDVVTSTQVRLCRIPDILLKAVDFSATESPRRKPVADAGPGEKIVLESLEFYEHQQDDQATPSEEGGDVTAGDAEVLHEAEAQVCFRLYKELQNDTLKLPSLPALALKVRKAIDDEVSDAKAIAHLVETDPAIAAKILKSASSALYGGRGNIDTVAGAIVRMGTNITTQLMMAFALNEVFRSKSQLARRQMRELWVHSTHVAAICFVIARDFRCMDPEHALLMGLVHDLGVIPVLSYADETEVLQTKPELLESVTKRLQGELGALILRSWSFSPDIVNAAKEAENWLRYHDGAADAADLLIVAQVHEHLAKKKVEALPPLAEISALQRVFGTQATPDKSLELIHAAADKIDEMRSVLQG